MNVLSLFDGYSSGMLILKDLDIKVDNYYASEICPKAIEVSKDNFSNIEYIGSITDINSENYKDVNLIIGGSSCQDFSIAGKQKGMVTKDEQQILNLEHYLKLKQEGFEFYGESYLFWEYVRLLKEIKPKYFLLENVKMKKEWENIITEALGVKPFIVDSSIHSSTNRKRTYWTNIPQLGFSESDEKLQDILDYGYTNRDKGLCLLESCSRPLKTPSKIARRYFLYGFWTVIFKDEATYEKLKQDYNLATFDDVRYLNQNEIEKSICLPIGYTKSVSRDIAAGLAGNAWNIKTVKEIMRGLKD